MNANNEINRFVQYHNISECGFHHDIDTKNKTFRYSKAGSLILSNKKLRESSFLSIANRNLFEKYSQTFC